jgi:hypothetical protein
MNHPDPTGPRRRSPLLHTRIRAEQRRLLRAGVHPHRALELAVYACRDGMAPHERNARRARRGYAVGDILELAETEPDGRYTGRCQRVQVTFLLAGPDAEHLGLAPQHVAMGITRLGRVRPCD